MNQDKLEGLVNLYIRKRMRDRSTYLKLDYVTRTNKKTVEARSLQGAAAQQRVKLPDTQLVEILEQMVKFPAGQHDDAVDALANLFLAIDKLYGGSARTGKVERKYDRWDRAYSRRDDDETDWRTV